jgi:hypothetical protein
MRTTVDLDSALLEKAKQQAQGEQRTLSSLINDALVAYFGARRSMSKDPPFEILTRGKAGGRFPSAAEIAAVEDEEDASSLAGVRGRRAAS